MTVSSVIPDAPAPTPAPQSQGDQSNDFYSYLRSNSHDSSEDSSDSSKGSSSVRESAAKSQKNDKPAKKTDKDQKTDTTATVSASPQKEQSPLLSIAALLGLPTIPKANTDETGKVAKNEGKDVLAAASADKPSAQKGDSNKGIDMSASAAALLNAVPVQPLNLTAAPTGNGDGKNDAVAGLGNAGAEKGGNAEILTAGALSDKTPIAAASGDLAFAMRLSEGKLDPNPQPHSLQESVADPILNNVQAGSANVATTVQAALSSQLKEQSHQHDGNGGSGLYEAAPANAQNVTDSAVKASDQPTQTSAADLQAKSEVTSQEPVRNVNMQVVGNDNNRVDVRLMDRGGELHVSVKSNDANLTQNLQDHMPELTSRLDQQRFQTEVWIPKAAESSKAEMSGSRDFSSGGNNNSGSSNTPDQQGKGQQQYRPDWVDVLENSTKGTGKIDQSWLQ